MRGLLVMLLVGCTISGPGEPGDPGGDIVPPGSPARDCRRDTDCTGGNVCTRSGACLPPSQVRAVHVYWLMNERPADYISCRPQPDLSINIRAAEGGGHVSYAPVPCEQGKFTVDKLPITFDQVELGPARGGSGWQKATLDASGEVEIHLQF